MTEHTLFHTDKFERSLDNLIASGRLPLLRAQALEDALNELRRHPTLHDGSRDDLSEPHWLKKCRAVGGVDTGLRVVYLLSEGGAVRLEDVFLLSPGQFSP